ncbi:MAG: urate hydroxylase PuuD [Reyranella sp.]|nr:urate hydroxylase PuuD [Reyranella sp.]
MDAAYVADWLNLVLRWAHMIVGIAWVGASFYFIWLDNHLHKPLDPADAAKGIGGEVWAVHGGGFYTAKKFTLAPATLPPELHWFKWEAYTTLITGFFLLCLVYYYGAEIALIDPSVMDLGKAEAIAIGLASLVIGWLVYDALCRSAFGSDDAVLGGLLFLYCAIAAWALCHLFSGRGAYIHFGAMLGTIMVLNVYFVIIPGQRELVKAKEEGRTPDPKHGLMGRQRSVHNTYFTLPVLFTMISNHYAGLYGHEWNWVLLLMISVAGALIRVWFVQRHKGGANPLVLAAGLVVLGLTAVLALPRPSADGGGPVAFDQVQPIIQARCVSCHATKPTQEGIAAPPKGVILETPAEIHLRAAAIYQQAAQSRVMPPGNMTHITDAERRMIARWFKGGAQ